MHSSYYDLDDILADGERIPCRFNFTVPGLGYLEGNPGKPIKEQTKLDLPIWIAEVLSVCESKENSGEKFIDLIEPEAISPKVLSAVKTSSTHVDLHALMGNYYKLVQKWGSMFSEPELIDSVIQMLRERAMEINNFANNTNKHVNGDFLFTLDEFEKRLFKETANSTKNMRKWMNE